MANLKSPGEVITPTRLPAELTDAIVSFLHDDEESLANCSLVCKGWLAITRYHIFKNLLLDPWNVEEFICLITHPSATIALYIHHLTIDQVKFRFYPSFEHNFRRLPRFDLLQTLELRNFYWTRYTLPAFESFINAFERITELRLLKPRYCDVESFQSLITSFPVLQRLAVFQVELLTRPGETPSKGGISSNLHMLELGDQRNTQILCWLLSQKVSLDSISIYLRNDELALINDYIHALGPSLLHLTLDFSGIEAKGEEPLLPFPDISFNTQLRTLRLSKFIYSHDMIFHTLPAMFSTIRSAQIDKIELDFSLLAPYVQANTSLFIWARLDDALCKLSGLRSICLSSHDFLGDPLIKFVKKGLSSCNDRGILHFKYHDHPTYRSLLSSSSSVASSRKGKINGPYCITNLQQRNI